MGQEDNNMCPLDDRPEQEIVDFENQSLKEQAWHILTYLESEPNQNVIPPGRIRLLKKTLQDYSPYQLWGFCL